MVTRPMRIYSADDVLSIPVPPELSGYELVNGELEPVSPVGGMHGQIAVELAWRLKNHVKENGTPGRVFAEAGYVLALRHDRERLRGPDVSFLGQAKLDQVGGARLTFFRIAPDLAVEIQSEQRPRVQQPVQDYLEAGTPLVWVIHAETNAATVYHPDGSARLLREADVLDGEDVLPGLRIPLSDLFER